MGHILVFETGAKHPARMPRNYTPSADFLAGISGDETATLKLLWRGRDRTGTPVDFWINKGKWWKLNADNLLAKDTFKEMTGTDYAGRMNGTVLAIVGLRDMAER